MSVKSGSKLYSVLIFFYHFLLIGLIMGIWYAVDDSGIVGGQYSTFKEFIGRGWGPHVFDSINILLLVYAAIFNTYIFRFNFKRAFIFVAVLSLSLYIPILIAIPFYPYAAFFLFLPLELLGKVFLSFPLGFISRSVASIKSKITKIVIMLAPILILVGYASLFIIPSVAEGCAGISDPVKKVACHAYNPTQNVKAYGGCLEVSNLQTRDDCLFDYLNYHPEGSDIEICQNITQSPLHNAQCYMMVAEHERDYKICAYISDPKLKDEQCLRFFIGYGQDKKVCDEVSDEGLKSRCLRENNK